MRQETRPWGKFEVLYESDTQWLKRITIAPGQSLSYQIHEKRDEYWVVEEKGAHALINNNLYVLEPGTIYAVKKGASHRLINPCNRDVSVLEWAIGSPMETDIVRLDDNYGR